MSAPRGQPASAVIVLGLMVVGVAFIAVGSDWLPAVIAGIAAILAAGILAMRSRAGRGPLGPPGARG